MPEHWPTEDQVIEAVNLTQRETKKGADAISKSEALSAQLRDNLPAEFHGISAQQLAGQAVNLRKDGKLEPVGTGRGQRSYGDLEVDGADREGMPTSRQRWYREKHLKSPEFAELREKCLEQAGYRCRFCNREHGKGSPLHPHHRTYANVGTPAELGDLVALCKRCHLDHHDLLTRHPKRSPLQIELEGWGE